MRHYVIYIIICLFLCACGSRKQSSHAEYTERVSATQTQIGTETIQSQATDSFETSKSINTDVSEYLKVTMFGDSGRISQIQETWRNTRSDELESGTRRASALSVAERKDSARSEQKGDVATAQDVKISTDTRAVQGVEWFYVILSLSAVVALVIAVIYSRLKKKTA